jgi:hypothetical protein
VLLKLGGEENVEHVRNDVVIAHHKLILGVGLRLVAFVHAKSLQNMNIPSTRIDEDKQSPKQAECRQ